MRTTPIRCLLLVLAAVLLLPTTAATPAHAADRTSSTEAKRVDRVKTPKIKWVEADDGSGYTGSVKLPRDYDSPKGATVTVALFRVPAADPTRKIGTLFLNPGGPGGSGVAMAAAAPNFLSQSVLDRFDIVGFDPRGTNASSPVKCFANAAKQSAAYAGLDVSFPQTSTEEAKYLAGVKRLAAGCAKNATAASMSTAQVARDLDVLRRAVGDKKLNYLGYSYGSYLGQVYANMFPDRFRAIAIDGVLDPIAWSGTSSSRTVPTSLRLRSAEGTWKALEAGLQACAVAGPDYCPLADPVADFTKVATHLRTSGPINIGGEGDSAYLYSYTDFISDLLGWLYYPDGMDYAALIIAALHQIITENDGTSVETGTAKLDGLLKAFRAQNPGLAVDDGYDNSFEAYTSVLCTDTYQPRAAKTWSTATAKTDATAPYFGRIWGWADAACATDQWKAVDEDAYHGSFSRETAAPILIVGNYHDPATNYDNALAAYQLLPNSYLVRSDSWGHTAYGTSDCVTDRVDAYLLAITAPAADVCVGDVQPFTSQLATANARSRTSTPAQATVPSRDGLPPVVPPLPTR